jgi:uncharacterized protein YndB with AHSA1/START domain
MTTPAPSPESAAANDADTVVVTRFLRAAPALVYEAWTEPRHVAHWWQPKGFGAPVCEVMDVRPGGQFRIQMSYEDGTLYTAWGEYREVVPGARIVYDDYCDVHGKTFHAAAVEVDFVAQEDGMRVMLRATFKWVPECDVVFPRDAALHGWQQGWHQNIDLLEIYLGQWRDGR